MSVVFKRIRTPWMVIMGDMADCYLEQCDWGCGDCDADPAGYEPPSVVCRYCGKGNFYWYQMETDGRWRLVDEKLNVHSCREYRR